MIDRVKAAVLAVIRTLRPSGSLSSQTVKSAVWSVGINVGARGLQLIMMIVLARLLTPRDIGLMGLALVTYSALSRFSRLGISRALVQRPEANVDEYLDTTWMMQIARSVLIAAILFFSAPFAAGFFDEPAVEPILQAIALSPLITGFFNPSIVYFEKSLELHKKFVFDMSGAITKFVIAVVLAFILESVWAFVYGYLAADVAKLIASYALDDRRPGLSFDREQAWELFGYGKWVTATSAISFLLVSGDDWLIGWLMSTAVLGYYQMGYRLGKTPPLELSRSLSTVMFPMFSKLQTDSEALANAVNKTIRILSFVSFPAAAGIVLTAPSFVRAFLGPQWLPIIPVMQIVAVYGAFSALTSTFNEVWNATGHPDYNTKINFARLVVTGAVIYPATTAYGIVGTVSAIAGIYVLLIVPVKTHLAVKSIGGTHRRFIIELAYPVFASVAMGAALYFLRPALSGLPAIAEFACLVVAGVVVYVSAVAVVESLSTWKIRSDLEAVLGAVRS
ncbi:export protein [Halogeometricum pallidum JCM 14848]|uniref:Export protein n=1 Tax=Halogeometricum pallidum JCM 14848 TaxID=1227487 RepID=M0D740_HALPD|nr:lipopolysaccharide biosynthesis protein [Halogeometricum pallidum]ELZ29964.1 export protein [Halogeometricum pallidum JCM 14848]